MQASDFTPVRVSYYKGHSRIFLVKKIDFVSFMFRKGRKKHIKKCEAGMRLTDKEVDRVIDIMEKEGIYHG